jgi:hypothetical protein
MPIVDWRATQLAGEDLGSWQKIVSIDADGSILHAVSLRRSGPLVVGSNDHRGNDSNVSCLERQGACTKSTGNAICCT